MSEPKILNKLFRNSLGYIVAIGAVALATWLKFLAEPSIIPANVPILYILAIVPTAVFFGLGPSLTVCVLSFLAYDYYFIPPLHQISYNNIDGPILAIFLLVGVLFSLLASNLRQKNRIAVKEIAARKQSETELVKYRDHLEELVQQRTVQLEKEIEDHRRTEEALKQSERQNRELLETANSIIIRWDNNRKINFINDFGLRFFGYAADELVGQDLMTIVPHLETTGRDMETLVKEIIANPQNHVSVPNENIRKDGTVVHVTWSNKAIYDSEGKFKEILAIGNDITELKKAESELNQLNRELRAISDCNQVIVRANDEMKLFTDVCRIMCDVVGYRMAWIGTVEHDNAKSILPVAWCNDDTEYLKQANISWADNERGRGATGIAARTGKTDFCQDFMTETKAVPWRETALARGFRSSIAIPLFDSTGSVFAVFTIYAAKPNGFTPPEVRLLEELAGDISFGVNALRLKRERIEAEDALRISEEKYRNLFDNMTEGFVVVEIIVNDAGKSTDFRYVEVNNAWTKMTGISQKDAVGRTVKELFPGISAQNLIDNFNKVAASGESVLFDFYNDDLKRWREIYAYSPQKDLVAYTLKDITDRKEVEEELRRRTTELEASNKELEAFSYSVSHDLRAPLRSITGFSAILMEDYSDRLDKAGKEYLHKIQDSGEKMGQLIDDLLKLARVTRVEMNCGEVNLTSMVEKIVEELAISSPKRKVMVSIAPNLKVYADINLLNQAMENLLSNAWKYTSKTTKPQIEVGSTVHEGKQAFFVRDNGVGFDMAYSNKLFQPFQRLHTGTEFSGTGIGLSIVQRVIRRHGGQIWAEAEVGKGATFYFTLN